MRPAAAAPGNPATVVRIVWRDASVDALTDHDAARRTGPYPTARIGVPVFGHVVHLGGGVNLTV